jgi:hypothetical protein
MLGSQSILDQKEEAWPPPQQSPMRDWARRT